MKNNYIGALLEYSDWPRNTQKYFPSLQQAFSYCERNWPDTFLNGEALQLLMLNWHYTNKRGLKWRVTPIE